MSFLKSTIAAALFAGSSWAASTVFEQEHVTWLDPELQLAFTDSVHQQFSADDFCRNLAVTEPDLGRPQCRFAGEWERDSSAHLYLQWLGRNLDARLKPEHLVTRDPAVSERLRKLDDRYLITFTQRGDTLWAALFSGRRTFEQAVNLSAPAALTAFTPVPADAKALAQLVATAWFSHHSTPRLNEKEKAAAELAPDESYGESPRFDRWVSLGAGWSQGSIPLTPSSWYANRIKDHVSDYGRVQDSLSLWSFITDESVLYTMRAGFTWNGFVGAEAFATQTHYRAKLDPSDTVYNELAHWNYTRTEVGLTVHGVWREVLSENVETQPYTFLGFHYSFLSEDIAVKAGRTPSDQYRYRVQFMPFYKGAIFGIGNRLMWYGTIAIDTRAGFSNRGRSLDREPSPDAVVEPTIIGGSTLDCFISASLEYHWRKKN